MVLALNLMLVDAALEPIPIELRNDEAVIRVARRLGRDPDHMPLDKALHFRAMGRLRNKEVRGRPDIVHKFLLDSLNSLLAAKGMLTVHIHTINGKVIEVAPGERPPQNYINFLGLMEQLFKYGSVPPGGKWLLRIVDTTLAELVKSMNAPLTILLERDGEPIRILELADLLTRNSGVVVMVSGIPRGSVSSEVRMLADRVYSLANGEPLTTSHVVNLVLAAMEIKIGLV